MKAEVKGEAFEVLIHEHRFIERVLGSFEQFIERMNAGTVINRDDLRAYVTFFREFADRCHHGKEEKILFETMKKFGFSEDAGPLAVMLSEHATGREHIQALAEIAAGSGGLTDSEKTTIREHVGAYSPLLRQHIQKEDTVLYPMASAAVPESVIASMVQLFDDFEENVMGKGRHEELHELADKLAASFVPRDVGETGNPCFACGGHSAK